MKTSVSSSNAVYLTWMLRSILNYNPSVTLMAG